MLAALLAVLTVWLAGMAVALRAGEAEDARAGALLALLPRGGGELGAIAAAGAAEGVVMRATVVPGLWAVRGEGEGFAIAQARLGPGRIHHCMRLIGMAERALELMCRRANERVAFGRPLAAQGVVREQVANARVAIEQARLLVLKTAWLMDTVGNRGAHTEIQAIKIAVPLMAQRVIDDAIQVHGGAGVSQDTPLAQLWVAARTLRLADGPDEVHRMVLARRELARYR